MVSTRQIVAAEGHYQRDLLESTAYISSHGTTVRDKNPARTQTKSATMLLEVPERGDAPSYPSPPTTPTTCSAQYFEAPTTSRPRNNIYDPLTTMKAAS